MKHREASICLRCWGLRKRVNKISQPTLAISFRCYATSKPRVRLAGARKKNDEGAAKNRTPSPAPQGQTDGTPGPEPDTRSPLERFRRPPKKALSVTDLVSPSWCELQYFYTLSKHGRKKRTPAMKQGSAVHQQLEDEVHITVPVEITTKEDSWGLRVWNIIQGLRTLRDTGRTRELEIWGTIGGEIVNGVIDELSYECPDPKLEGQIMKDYNKADESPVLPEYQTSITDYLQSGVQDRQSHTMEQALSTGTERPQTKKDKHQSDKRIYITDVKTRASPTLPTGSSIRPTVLQLHLYHHMLENLAQGNFSLVRLTERYGLDPNATFSDFFIAQIGNLNQDLFETGPSQEDQRQATQPISSQDSMDILLQHANLSALWDYMISQFRTTFVLKSSSSATTIEDPTPTPTPQSISDLHPPALQPTRLSPIITAEYLSPSYRHVPGTTKKFLGRKSFVFNSMFLKSYLEDNLAWWRGEREARGVELQEAWKCRSCDFRDDCEWIHERDEAALEEVRERKKMREVAGVEKGSIGTPTKSRV